MYGLVPGHLAMRSGAGRELKHRDLKQTHCPFQPNPVPAQLHSLLFRMPVGRDGRRIESQRWGGSWLLRPLKGHERVLLL